MLSLHFIWAGCETDSGGELELGLAEGTGTADFVDKSRVVQVIPDEGSTVASHTIMSSNRHTSVWRLPKSHRSIKFEGTKTGSHN